MKHKEYIDVLKMPLGLTVFMLLTITCNILNVAGINNNYILETYPAKTGITCYLCSEGMYWVEDCNRNMTTSVCKPCPNETFNNKPGIPHACSSCQKFCIDLNSHIVKKCTQVSDIVCECNEGYYRHYKVPERDVGNDWICKPHSVCSEGLGVADIGTSERNTVCKKCQQRETYSNTSSRTEKCQNCTKCEPPLFEEQTCNAVNDTVCSLKENNNNQNFSDELLNILFCLIPVAIILAILFIIILKRKKKLCFSEKDTKKVRTSKESLNSFTNTACNYIAEDLQEAGLETDGQSQISDSWQKGQKKMNLGTSLKVHTVAAREHPTWDRLFMELSGKIIPCWEFVVLDLYGTGGNSKIDEAKENYPRDVKRQIYFCLNKWKESLKDPPSIEMVISVLARHRQLSQNDINKLKKKYSSL